MALPTAIVVSMNGRQCCDLGVEENDGSEVCVRKVMGFFFYAEGMKNEVGRRMIGVMGLIIYKDKSLV